MSQATKDGTTIAGREPGLQEKIEAAQEKALGPDRTEGSENVQGSGLTPDGEENGDVEKGVTQP
jgi:hypothetical protein